jgi:hypothetical protein
MKRLFFRIYWFYKKFGDYDVFFSTAFLISFVSCLLINFIIGLTYYLTGIEWLVFKTKTVGVFLLIPFTTLMVYMYKQNPELKNEAEEFNMPMQPWDWFLLFLILIGLGLGFFAAFLFRWRYLGY